MRLAEGARDTAVSRAGTTVALPTTRQLLTLLSLPVLFFAVVNLAMAWLIAEYGEGWRFSKLSLDGEATAPAYFNALLLLLTGLLFGLVSTLARRDADRMWWRWAVLCVVSTGMSVDEAVGFHEIVGERFGRLLPDEGMPFNAWVFLGGAAVVVVGLVVSPLLLHVDRRTSTALVGAAVLFVGGAIGMELVAEPSALASEWTGPLYTVLMTIEEVMEMTALLLVIATLHDRLTRGGRLELLVPSSH